MQKGYLIIDDIPKYCDQCCFERVTGYKTRLCNAPRLRDDYSIVRREVGDGLHRPDWCPIKGFPEWQVYENDNDEFGDGYDLGWNTCLNIVLGENER